MNYLSTWASGAKGYPANEKNSINKILKNDTSVDPLVRARETVRTFGILAQSQFREGSGEADPWWTASGSSGASGTVRP